jgi:hypothetical protein
VTDFEPTLGVGEVREYLSRNNWNRAAAGDVAELWNHSEYPGFRMIVPLIESAPDFGKRLGLLTAELANLEDRPKDDITFDVATMFFDVINAEAKHSWLIRDSIPVDAGQRLFSAAYKLMEAAAGATIRRQGHFGHQMPTRARDHTKHRLRLGHTRRGSYILPILSLASPALPVVVEDEPTLDMAVEFSLFDRRVVATLSDALNALTAMVVNSPVEPTESEILDSIQAGVSYEFCQAIENVTAISTVESFDVAMKWAPSTAPPANAIDVVAFPREASPIINRIADRLRDAPEIREDVIYGIVKKLERSDDSTELGTGRAGVETIIDRKRHIIWMDLDESAHRVAVQCYEEGKRVRIRGVLAGRKGRYTMQPISFVADPAYLF